jgi:hypothetical protein
MIGFRRNQKNRRTQRQYVLDVRLRTRETRTSWVRVLTLSMGLAVGGAAGLFGLGQGTQWVLDQCFLRNPAFEIRRLEIDTGELFPIEWVAAWSGIHSGQNLMDLDLERVKRSVEREPLAASVAVQRVPPDILRIRVRPRVPVLLIQRHETRPESGLELVSYYVDSEGYVMRFTPTQEAVLRQRLIRPGLPRVTGVPPQQLVSGLRLKAPNVEAALTLAQRFGDSPMSGLADLADLDLSRPEVVVVRTAQGNRITFGLQDPARPLARWRQVHDFAAHRGQVIKTLDLSLTNNVPAVLQQPEAVQRPASPGGGPSTQRRANA